MAAFRGRKLFFDSIRGIVHGLNFFAVCYGLRLAHLQEFLRPLFSFCFSQNDSKQRPQSVPAFARRKSLHTNKRQPVCRKNSNGRSQHPSYCQSVNNCQDGTYKTFLFFAISDTGDIVRHKDRRIRPRRRWDPNFNNLGWGWSSA